MSLPVELHNDIIRLFEMVKEVKTDFQTMHDRYIDAETLYQQHTAETQLKEFPLKIKIDRLEKILRGFVKAVEEKYGVEVAQECLTKS